MIFSYMNYDKKEEKIIIYDERKCHEIQTEITTQK